MDSYQQMLNMQAAQGMRQMPSTPVTPQMSSPMNQVAQMSGVQGRSALQQQMMVRWNAVQKKKKMVALGVIGAVVVVGLITTAVLLSKKKKADSTGTPSTGAPASVTAKQNNGTCNGSSYCYTNWNNEVKSAQPTWVGAKCASMTDAATGTVLPCNKVNDGKSVVVVCVEDKDHPFPTIPANTACGVGGAASPI